MAPPPRAAAATASRLAPLPYAGLQLRIVAFLLDILVLISFGMLFLAAAIGVVIVDSDFTDRDPSDSAFLAMVAILLAYVLAFLPLYHILLWSWRGQTVGKMAVRIRVLSRNGGRVSLGQSTLRLLGYAASATPLFLGLVIALVDGERRALHDILAGTVVVELP